MCLWGLNTCSCLPTNKQSTQDILNLKEVFVLDEIYYKFKAIVSRLYYYFLAHRHRFVRPILLMVLILSVIIGAGYRSIVLKDRFVYEKQSFEWIISMASNYGRAPGKYSWEEARFIREHPDEYVYTVGKSKFKPKSKMRSEIGWPLILHLILKDGIKGLDNIALFIARYQLMVELFVIVLLFWAGKGVAGGAGACLAAFLYGTFKIPMVLMSDAYYYYWTIPFSALSLLFWTVVYRPGDDRIKIHWKYLSFFLYGVLIGFASFVRLYFTFLPLFMAPLLFVRERAIKKGLVLLAIILLGQSVFLVPQIVYNKKHFGEYALTTRGHWHLHLQGVGLYPDNPWGIPDSGEINLNLWAVERGCPDMLKPSPDGRDPTDASEEWFKKEYFKMVKEHPEFFIEKFFKHLKGGLTVSPTDFQFFGLVDKPTGFDLVNKFFPWLVLSALCILFIVSRSQFWIGVAVSLQGLYLLLVVVTWFGNYTPFIASYIPVFILLLAMAVAVHIKVLIALIEGSIRCWVNDNGIRSLPKTVVDCYREDWEGI